MKNINKTFSLLVSMILGLSFNHLSAQETEVKPSGNVWGYVFGDYYFKQNSDTLGRAPSGSSYGAASLNSPNQNQTNMNALQIRRAYLGYDYTLDSRFSAQVVLAHEMDVDANGYNTVYVKYAWVKWSNIFKGSNLMIGQLPTSSFATAYGTEQLWGYRSVEKTLLDLHGTDGSSDMGVALMGNLWKQKTENNSSQKPSSIGYHLMVANGSGAKPETDRFKKLRGNLYVNTLDQKLTLGVYADYNMLQSFPYEKSNATIKGYVHFKTDIFKVGVEAFQQINHNTSIFLTDTSPKSSVTADGVQFGVSVFGSSRIIKNKLNVFGRVDYYNPDTKFSSNNYKYTASAVGGNLSTTTFYTQTFYLLGLDYTPTSRIHIMPNIWFTQYDTMKGTDAAGKDLTARTKSDYDFVARITFFFIFNSSKSVSNNGMDF